MQEELKNHANKWRALWKQGLKTADIKEWDSKRFEEFFSMYDKFIENGKLKVTDEKIIAFQNAVETATDHPLAEFFARIGFTWDAMDPKMNTRFSAKLMTMARIVSQYVRKNPASISTELILKLKDKPQYKWMVEFFQPKEPRIGGLAVIETTNPRMGNIDPSFGSPKVSYEKMLLEATLKVANLYDMVAGSIKPKDLNRMSAGEKIKALSTLASALSVIRSYKPNAQVFQQININKGGREELESAMLDLATVRERDK